MTKSRRMQVMVTEKLAATIADYQAEHNVSQSRACQALMSMGARAWRRYKKEEGQGGQNRGTDEDSFITAALKELLQSSYATQALLNMTADKVLEKSHDKNNQPYAAKPLIKKSHQLAERAVTNLIHGLPEDP
jgi:hypothetical protein